MRLDPCPTCRRSGRDRRNPKRKCRSCGGVGYLPELKHKGFMSSRHTYFHRCNTRGLGGR